MVRIYKKSAFTLSEVLLVLAVLGVVAALTIPTLTQKVGDSQNKSAWKKAFSVIAQTTNLIMTNNSGQMNGLCPTNDMNCMRDSYAQRLSVIKTCNAAVIGGNCWHNVELPNTISIVLGDDAGFILSDGSFWALDWDSVSCSEAAGPGSVCGKIMVDVNGFRPPNVAGKDVFAVWVLNDRVVPAGPSNGYVCTNGQTIGCSAELLYQ